MKVVVVGAGAAGTAAAWSASRRGASVTVFHAHAGASPLYSGALDLHPWTHAQRNEPLDAEVLTFAAAFSSWSVGADRCHIATEAGVVRPARGTDTALLDLASLAGKTIGVADVGIETWDAPSIARTLGASAWATQTSTRFVAVEVDVLERPSERKLRSFDLATVYDEPARAARLGDRLQAAKGSADAWLLGPWLGTTPAVAELVRERVDKPCGETTSAPGGAAGARFEHSRDELLGASAAVVERLRVTAVERAGSGWRVARADGGFAEADAVILAIGGVAAGGLLLDVPSERPGQSAEGGARKLAGVGFHLSLDAPVLLELDGHRFEAVASVHGLDLQAIGMAALERVGISAHGVKAAEAEGLSVAGDVVAGRPRTVLEAVSAGIAAGRAAVGRT